MAKIGRARRYRAVESIGRGGAGIASVVVALTFVVVCPIARADATAGDEASRLFEQAKLLMDQSRYGEACPVLDRSQSLDPQLGTLLNLAYCYENLGRTATAWSFWLDAAAAAETRGEAQREAFARTRASQLEPRLVHITVVVTPQPATDSLDVRLDGAPLLRSRWGTPIPIDPGTHWIQANATGRRPHWEQITVDDQYAPPVTVPVLLIASTVEAVRVPAERVSGPRMSWRRPGGILMAGAGVAAVATGAVLAGLARATYDASSSACGTAVCTAQGSERRLNAIAEANAASVAFATGTAAVIGGAILWFTAPTNPNVVRLGATATPRDWAVTLHGRW